MQIDRNFDVPQCFAVAEKGATLLIFLNAAESCGNPGLPSAGRLPAKSGKTQGSWYQAGFPIALACESDGSTARGPKSALSPSSARKALQAPGLSLLRRAWAGRRRRIRNDPGLGRGKRLLLDRLGEAGKKGFVDVPVSARSCFQFAQMHLRLPRRGRLLEDLVHTSFDRSSCALAI